MSPVTNFSASLWVRALQETRISQDVAVYILLLQSLFLRSGFHCFFFPCLFWENFCNLFKEWLAVKACSRVLRNFLFHPGQ